MNVVPDRPVMIGPYRLVGTLGEGGMGVVHLGLDPAGRAVAVKVLKPHVAADADARRRLGREVASLRRVRHPNIADVLDADLQASPPYVVTAFVPARTLDAQVREHGPLPVPYAAHLGRVLTGALRAIHAAGVVHRDVKPANVLLLDDAPVLIDFGIAHVVDEARITSSGLVMGTPGYLPPELVEGQPITPATDWWGWGATLAYAATGRAPFGSGPSAVVLDRVRRGQVDLAGVDPRLGRVLSAALTVNPVWRGTGDMLLSGLSEIEPWRPGQRPMAPALRPDQVHTVPITAQAARDAIPTEVVPQPPNQPMNQPSVQTKPLPEQPVHPVHAPTAQPPTTQPPITQPPAGQPPNTPAADVWAPGAEASERSMSVLLMVLLAALVATAAVAPGLVVLLSGLWLVVVRVIDRTVTATLRRRAAYGPRSGDVGAAVAALPWRVLTSLPRGLLALVFPVLLGGSAAFLAAAIVAPTAPDPQAAMPLAAGALIGWFGAWWGPGGAVLRRGTRTAGRSLTRRGIGGRAVLVLAVFVLAAAVLVAAGGAEPDWQPLGMLVASVPSPNPSAVLRWMTDLAFGWVPDWRPLVGL